MAIKAIMFDLDGTLLDTLSDIAAAVNHAMAQLGRPALDREAVRRNVGHGVEHLMRESLGPDAVDQLDPAIAAFLEYYADHAHDQTTLYDGIDTLLDTVLNRNLPMAVLSNKPHAAAEVVVEALLGRWEFVAVQGGSDDYPLKPDPASALAIVDRLGMPASDWHYVGDSDVDMQTAVNAGMVPVGVTWGFRDEPLLRANGAQVIVHRPIDLIALL